MKVYFPVRFEDVDASHPHPENTKYRASYGHEHWGEGEPATVYKVQMVYDGEVSGRKAPSYPVGTDDFARMLAAMDRVMRNGGAPDRREIPPI
jgi:hypothetical protein